MVMADGEEGLHVELKREPGCERPIYSGGHGKHCLLEVGKDVASTISMGGKQIFLPGDPLGDGFLLAELRTQGDVETCTGFNLNTRIHRP